jgi:hypothetical protein
MNMSANKMHTQIVGLIGVLVTHSLEQWYSTFFVRIPVDIISLQLCTHEVVGA